MCPAGPASHAGAMTTSTVNPEPAIDDADRARPSGSGPDRAALRRPGDGRMLAGVAGGLARSFGADATVVRVAFAGLAIAGGAGIPLYLAGLLLIPGEGSDQPLAGALIESR